MTKYTLFLTWQSEKPESGKTINKALDVVKNKLAEQDIELEIDSDTRKRIGKKNINNEVLAKIENAQMALIDLTPVHTIEPNNDDDLPRHMPNSNVLFEYGYALKTLGEDRMILVANLQKGQHKEFMPFDINHDTISDFELYESTDAGKQQLKIFATQLTRWIKNIIEDIKYKEEHATLPLDCDVCLFNLSNSDCLKPQYIKTTFVAGEDQRQENNSDKEIPAVIAMNPMKMQEAILKGIGARALAKQAVFKPIQKKTDLSCCPINILLRNTGEKTLQHCELSLRSDRKDVIFLPTNEEHTLFNTVYPEIGTFIGQDRVTQKREILHSGKIDFLPPVFVKIPVGVTSFNIEWTVDAVDYNKSGIIEMQVEPIYQEQETLNNTKVGEVIIEPLIKYE